jgi:hypothetical protein
MGTNFVKGSKRPKTKNGHALFLFLRKKEHGFEIFGLKNLTQILRRPFGSFDFSAQSSVAM